MERSKNAFAEISDRLGCAALTIYRELKRNFYEDTEIPEPCPSVRQRRNGLTFAQPAGSYGRATRRAFCASHTLKHGDVRADVLRVHGEHSVATFLAKA